MLKVKDIMTTHVVTVDMDDSVDCAICLMVKNRISGLPVLDKSGRPVAVVSEFDLLELICEGRNEQCKVRDYMSAHLIAVCEEDSWVTVADMFRTVHVRRLPVLRDGNLVGIVTRHDLVGAIRGARRQIRQELARRVCLATSGQACPATMPSADPETNGIGA
jgi:predicted transcriptional regulator